MGLRGTGLREWGEVAAACAGGAGALAAAEEVDVAFNSLASLMGVEACANLRRLDVRFNRLPSQAALVEPLRRCPHLQELHMTQCGPWARKGMLHLDLFALLPALNSLNGVPNPSPLTDQQWRAQRFLQRLFGILPHGVSEVDLNGCSISGEEFPMVLRALSHLPVRKLWMQMNPCSGMPGYRACLVDQLPRLCELDGAPVKPDERMNAARVLRSMNAKTKTAIRGVAWQTEYRGSSRRHSAPVIARLPSVEAVPPGSGTGRDEQGSVPVGGGAATRGTGGAGRALCHVQSAPPGAAAGVASLVQMSSTILHSVESSGLFESPGASRLESHTGLGLPCESRGSPSLAGSTGGALCPRGAVTGLGTPPVNSPQASRPASRVLGSRLHEVASKALQEDIADFLAADPVAETLKMNVENPGLLKSVEVAPTAAITGSLTMKLEILLNYLQVFWLIYNWDVRWPTLWVEIYSNFDFTRIVLTAIPSLAFSGSAGGSAAAFYCLIFFPALCWVVFLWNQEDCTCLQEMNFRPLERLCWKLAGQSWEMFRRRAALFGITATYLPLARLIIMSFVPDKIVEVSASPVALQNGTAPEVLAAAVSEGAVGAAATTHMALSTSTGRQVLAGLGIVAYIVATPLIFVALVQKGTKEATAAHDIQAIETDIAQLTKQLLKSCEDGDYHIATRTTEKVKKRRRAHELMYARSVREYCKPQGYLYQDYREHMKFFKCAVLLEKLLLLALTVGIGYAGTTMPQLRLVQTSLGCLCVLSGAVVVVAKRPFQAPAENILESVLRSVNFVNAAVALLLAIVQETASEPRAGSVADTIVAGALICLNVSALGFCLGELSATPWMTRVAKTNIDRLKQDNIAERIEVVTAAV